jgi:hypothetical protein
MLSKIITTSTIIVGGLFWSACTSFDVRYCSTGVVHISQACPPGAKETPPPKEQIEREKKVHEETLELLHGKNQARISETAPPAPVNADSAVRDPSLRRNVGNENSQVHP